uniref:Uncharacterized protein n=1 Tax=Janibacter limosus TaxID=53458 RepID=A0AC61U766_9MICO|nr:hypothetical protein [Janibacter limosus]
MVNFAQVTPQGRPGGGLRVRPSRSGRVPERARLRPQPRVRAAARRQGLRLQGRPRCGPPVREAGPSPPAASSAAAGSGAAKVLRDPGFEVTEPAASSPEVIPATGARRDVSDMGSDAAREAWSAAARPVLLDIARRYRAVITYSELSAEIQRQTGIRTKQGLQHWIGKVLERIAIDCHDREEPNLSSLVVNSSGSVGAGYAAAVRTSGGEEPADLDDHAAAERLACHRHFEAADLPAGGGTAALSPQLAQRRERIRSRATPRRSRSCARPASSRCRHRGSATAAPEAPFVRHRELIAPTTCCTHHAGFRILELRALRPRQRAG